MPQHRQPALLKVVLNLRVGLALLAAMFVCAAGPAISAQAAPRKVTISPAGGLLLPENWTITAPILAANQIAEIKESLGVSVASETAFFAVKNNPGQKDPIAWITLERTQAAILNNNIIPLLKPEEQEEIYTSMRMVMSEVFKASGAAMDIAETTFKTFGRYHALIMSMHRSEGDVPLESHVVYYFLPEQTHILSVVCKAAAVKELNPDFTVIMDSFDPDKNYRPESPPERKEGESLPDYLNRVYTGG